MKIYYHPLSFPSLGPVFTAEATKTVYDKVLVDLQTGEQSSPEYLKVNPYGKVPAMVDEGFNLAESAAIMKYIAKKSGSSLYPSDNQGQAKVDQWLDYINHHIRTNIGKVHFNRSLAAMLGVDVDEKSLADGLRFLDSNLPIIETQLSNSPFLHGDSLTIADITLIAALEPIDMSKIGISQYPSLSKWLSKNRKENFYTAVHTHYGAELGL